MEEDNQHRTHPFLSGAVRCEVYVGPEYVKETGDKSAPRIIRGRKLRKGVASS